MHRAPQLVGDRPRVGAPEASGLDAAADRVHGEPQGVRADTAIGKLGLEPTAEDNRRVLAVLAYLKDPAR